ncbi:MAG: ABC-F family ATP-binding cassette domain-containing protein [Chitinophagaceae bacterium]
MISIQHLAYAHPNKDVLFNDLQFTMAEHTHAALIGNNGSGKSTLLKIITGGLQPTAGQIQLKAPPYYVPQLYGQLNHLTVSQALGIDKKLTALQEILSGQVTMANMDILGDDWTLEERCVQALQYWQLTDIDLQQSMGSLSGGQKTRVLLAGISIHQPALVLMDEPSNHLDAAGRQLLYSFVAQSNSTMLIVSHDRALLHLLNPVCELSSAGITVYGGNYSFYTAQKQLELEALHNDVKSQEKALRKAREKERETQERQQRLDARGKQKQEKAGVARIMMNTLRNKAENSTSRLREVHAEKIDGIYQELQSLRSELPVADQMKFGFADAQIPKGKLLFRAEKINYHYDRQWLWSEDLDAELYSSDRLVLKGGNGSGKTTLIHILLGQLQPEKGSVFIQPVNAVYLDQDYSLINNALSVYEQAQQFNTTGLQEHEVKIRLHRFLFSKQHWDRSCAALSGGERMRLILCCLTLSQQAPDLLILDEPTNNLDIQNVEILTAALKEYRGTLVLVSHDHIFLKETGVEREMKVEGYGKR